MNKGFTLVELLVTIGVLVLVLLIVTPSLIGVINNSRRNAFEETKKNIENAASLYMMSNRRHYPEEIGGTYILDIETLQEQGHLEDDIINPITGEIIVGATVIVTKMPHGGYEFELDYHFWLWKRV